jgi:hypothetical protein
LTASDLEEASSYFFEKATNEVKEFCKPKTYRTYSEEQESQDSGRVKKKVIV